jgi:hypothetical protein
MAKSRLFLARFHPCFLGEEGKSIISEVDHHLIVGSAHCCDEAMSQKALLTYFRFALWQLV